MCIRDRRRTDLMSDDSYYTTEQVQQLYGLKSTNICHIVKVHHISKVKVGVKNLLLKTDVERAMAESCLLYTSLLSSCALWKGVS